MASIRGRIISGNPNHTTVGRYVGGANGETEPSDATRPRSTIVHTQGSDYTNNFTGGNANDRGISRDRHVVLTQGSRNTGSTSGNHDATLDGPIRPSLLSVTRTINTQQGSDSSNTDDLERGYNKVSTGQWAGQQDGSVQPVYGGTPGMWQPYGSYGGMIDGPFQGIQSQVAPGSAGDGPQRINSGLPHGLHSGTLNNGAQMWARYNVIPQMAGPTTSRPFNSKIAGQSYSQTIVPLGQNRAQFGTTVAGQVALDKTPGTSWRGR